MNYRTAVFLVIALALAIVCQGAWATVYYVSQSQGNDSYTGLDSTHPWKTLTKLSGTTFQAGDSILLKCGDTWTGETLYAHGVGNQTNPITVSIYGSGNRPAISPGGGAWCAIQLSDDCAGWTFYYLSISNAQYGIFSSSPSYQHDFTIDMCNITDCTSGGVYIHPPDGPANLDRVAITGSYFNNCGDAVQLHRVNNCNISNNYLSNMPGGGLCFNQCSGGSINNCTIVSCGLVTHPLGTAAVYFAVCSGFVMDGCDISYTQRPNNSPDGVAIDFEGNNTNMTVQNCLLHDNQGAAILLYRNPDWGSDNSNINFLNNSVWNNGLFSPSTVPSFMRHYNNASCGGNIIGNDITLLSGQKCSWIDTVGYYNWFQNSFTCDDDFIDGGGTWWDAVSEFSTSSNPNGVWTYQTGYGPSNMWNLWHVNGLSSGWAGLISWDEAADWPFVAKNNTGSTYYPYWGWCYSPTSYLVLEPFRPEGKWVGVKFTAPSAGFYTVKSQFNGLNTGGYTDANSHIYWSTSGTHDSVRLTGSDLVYFWETQWVNQGQSISFLVDGNSVTNYGAGFTGLYAFIVKLN